MRKEILYIRPEETLKQVQTEFTNAYPFLKLEFFRNGNVRKARYPRHLLLPASMQIKDASFLTLKPGELLIAGNIKVRDLEVAMFEDFGLAVEVFRKSANIWLETTITDDWSLKQQNEHGKEITVGIAKKANGMPNTDYDLERDSDH